jgi:hypothetical protein
MGATARLGDDDPDEGQQSEHRAGQQRPGEGGEDEKKARRPPISWYMGSPGIGWMAADDALVRPRRIVAILSPERYASSVSLPTFAAGLPSGDATSAYWLDTMNSHEFTDTASSSAR